MPDYLEDFKEHEYVEFYFYGYKPFKAMKDQNGFKDFNIVLYPMYKPSYFDGSLFNYGRNKIIDNEQKAIFKEIVTAATHNIANKCFSGMRRFVARVKVSCTLIGNHPQSLTGHIVKR